MSKYSKKAMDRLGAAATVAEEIISSVRLAQAFGSEGQLAKLYDDNLAGAQRMGYRIAFVMAMMIATMYFVILATYALGFCIIQSCCQLISGQGSRMIASGEINTGQLLTVIWAVLFGAMSLGSIGLRIEAFAKAVAAAQEIFQTIWRVPSIDSSDPGGKKPHNIEGSLEFKDVSLIYPSRPEGSDCKTVSDV